MSTPTTEHFLVDFATIDTRLQAIDPRAYDRTRNHLDGATTWLGPFLTHGVISTSDVAQAVLARERPDNCYRLLFELGWREFFHRTWQLEGEAIFSDLRHAQPLARHTLPSAALLEGRTGLQAIDASLATLHAHGTMHNHARMWIAAIACNLAYTHWREPARWLHHHLLDGDLASNTLSWQWVAGTFSDKRYVANQDNLNRFAGTAQQHTWLDVPYEALERFKPPPLLDDRAMPVYDDVPLPGAPIAAYSPRRDRPLGLRSIWHLDPRWRTDIAQQIVFVDTDLLDNWPLSANRWRLIEHWASRCGATLVHGTVEGLQRALEGMDVTRVEYPACANWPGRVEPRDWLYPMPAETFPSFSRFWKQVRSSIGSA